MKDKIRPTHHPMDKLLKTFAENYINYILEELNYDFRIDYVCPNELIARSNEYRSDVVGYCREKRMIVLVELHTSELTDPLIKRNTNYAKLIRDKYDICVLTLVISTVESKKIINYEFYKDPNTNEKLSYKIFVETFKELNGDKIYEKIKNKEKLEKKDIGYLSVLPLMETKESEGQVILKACKLTNQLKIDDASLEYLKTSQKHLTEYFLDREKDEELIKEIMDVIKMKKFDLFEEEKQKEREEGIKEGIEKGIKKGIKEGIKKRNLEIIESMKSKGLTIEEISDYARIDINEIKKLT